MPDGDTTNQLPLVSSPKVVQLVEKLSAWLKEEKYLLLTVKDNGALKNGKRLLKSDDPK